jgi:hypothetical protein
MAAEPATTLFGVKHSALLAGFVGSLVALTFLRELTRLQMLTALGTGLATSTYLTPLVMHYFGVTQDMNDGVAFLLGVVAMNIIPAVIAISESIKNDPLAVIKKFIPK